MSLTYGFYSSLNGDRKYNTEQISRLFDGIINDGIFASIGTCMVVQSAGGLALTVGVGRAWFNSTWTLNDSIYPLTADAAEVLLDRIDAVVLEVDATESARVNSIKIVKGIPSSQAVKPTLTNTALIHQHVLCYITRPAGATEITQAQIENRVGTSETPFVTGILQTVSLDTLLQQWDVELDQFVQGKEEDISTWFEQMQGQIGTDAAVNLQNQVTSIQEVAGLKSKTTTIATDGTITEQLTSGAKIVTTMNQNGTITEKHYNIGGTLDRTKTTTFNANGSISEVIS